MKYRRGFTLVGLLVVLTLGSALIAVSGPFFHRLFLAQTVGLQQSLRDQNLTRLSRQFRQDAHGARSPVTLDATKDELRLHSGDGQIVYRIVGASVVRELWSGDQQGGRDAFKLPGCRIRFHSGPDGGHNQPLLFQLQIERGRTHLSSKPEPAEPVDTLTIQVEVGRTSRLQRQAESSPIAEDSL